MKGRHFRDNVLLARLLAAETVTERGWLVMGAVLDSLPSNLRAAIWAAAVPHWFDAEILAELLGRPVTDGAALYADLQTLPFVEPFEARGGHNIHALIRTIILDRLWSERRSEYIFLSTRAASYFSRRDEPHWQTERAYHRLNVKSGREPADLRTDGLLGDDIDINRLIGYDIEEMDNWDLDMDA